MPSHCMCLQPKNTKLSMNGMKNKTKVKQQQQQRTELSKKTARINSKI